MTEPTDLLAYRIEECDEWQRDAFRAWHASGDSVADCDDLPSLSDFEEQYAGEWASFREYADEMADDVTLGGADPNSLLVRYFDHDAWARDLAHDYWTAPTADGAVYVFRAL